MEERNGVRPTMDKRQDSRSDESPKDQKTTNGQLGLSGHTSNVWKGKRESVPPKVEMIQLIADPHPIRLSTARIEEKQALKLGGHWFSVMASRLLPF